MADEQPPRSPLADEAARLIGVMQEWTRQTFPAAPEGHGGSAPVCQWCPLCQFMAVLRGDRPEVTERVTEAGAALASALRAAAGAAHRSRRRFEQHMSLAIGVDIGGTKVAAGVVDETGRVIDRERRDTPGDDAENTETVIVGVVDALRARHEVAAVGIGAAGWVGTDNATVLFSPHLAWRGEPLRADLERRIDLPLVVENDANAAAWAEYRFGVAAGQSVVVIVTLGTGIGGALIVDGTVFRGAYGIACEFGHMTVVPDGRICACGNRGCWEMYASGRALARDARELATDSPVAAERMMRLAGSTEKIDGPIVSAAADEGDPAALSICTNMGRWLGKGLASLAAVLDPSMFVIGGGVSAAGELLLGPARQEYRHTLTGRGFRPVAEIRQVALGPDAGLIGAADLARAARD